MHVEGLGRRLKEARKAKGLSQAAVARELGVEPHTVYRYERDGEGSIAPPSATLLALAQLFAVSADWLLTGEGPHTPPLSATGTA